MSSVSYVDSLREAGYRLVNDQQMFGRSSHLMSGDPIFEGGYRAVAADEMFGVGVQLAEQSAVAPLAPTFLSSGAYQLLVALSLLFYLNMLVRSWGFMGVVWGNVLSLRGERRSSTEGAVLPLSSFKVMAVVVGAIMLALVGVRIADLQFAIDGAVYEGLLFRMAAPLALLFVALLFVWVYLLHLATGWISQSTLPMELSSITTINFVRYVVSLYPLVAVWLVAAPDSVQGWGVALICCSILLLLIYLKDIFVFFFSKKIPILYWFLYLCTAFLLPISFVVTMLQR